MFKLDIKYIIVILLIASSCKVLPTKPYLASTAKIEIVNSNLSKQEKNALKTKLLLQQDDSVKVTFNDKFFFIHTLVKPTVYDSIYSHKSANNMEASLHHLGYYKAIVRDSAMFKKSNQFRFFKKSKPLTKVGLKYFVTLGVPTKIDTFTYRLKNPEFQQIALNSQANSFIKTNTAVTKTAILSEIARLVDSFRNNGYYKFTASELRMRGDSSVAALTNLSDDPFEQLELLNEVQRKRDSPTIKLALVVVKPEDTTKLNKFYINKIFVLSDFRQGDNVGNLKYHTVQKSASFLHLFHQNLFKTSLLENNITLRSGEVYRQKDFYATLNNLTKLGVWQNVNIRLLENLDSVNKIDIIIELLPAKKLTPSASLDVNYSAAGANNNVVSGNLFGTAINFSLDNKNFAREAIRMSHNLRFGIEFNSKKRTNSNNLIQSNEASYSNNVIVPRLLIPAKEADVRYWYYKFLRDKYFRDKTKRTFLQKYRAEKAETFINTNFAYNNRFNLFNLQTVGLSYGYKSKTARGDIFSFKFLNAEFSKLFNKSDTFQSILNANPFLNYSYNTAFTVGLGASYYRNLPSKVLKNTLTRERNIKFNIEESGLTWGQLPILKDFKRNYIKFDAEYKSIRPISLKQSLNTRVFLGIGKPLKNDDALPFFKQYASGGSNSMRGWPIRGIGRGGQKLATYGTGTTLFNDRTGDIQLELNSEWRHDITPIFSWLKLKGAVFTDVGNVWNFKESLIAGVSDNSEFKFNNLYKQLGMSAGYGFRFDFTYLVLRTDFGFRIKRPETSDVNNGWKLPDIGISDAYNKIFKKDYRQWRYENFNFSIGINYPF